MTKHRVGVRISSIDLLEKIPKCLSSANDSHQQRKSSDFRTPWTETKGIVSHSSVGLILLLNSLQN